MKQMDSRTTVDADTWRTGGKAAKVTLMVDDVPVAQVLQALAEQEKLNWSLSPDVSGNGVVTSNRCSLEAGTTNCSEKRRTDNAAGRQHSSQCIPLPRQNNNIARREAEQARAQANLPLENRSITLQYADAGRTGESGEKLLSAKGSMTVDKRNQSPLLRDNKTALSAL